MCALLLLLLACSGPDRFVVDEGTQAIALTDAHMVPLAVDLDLRTVHVAARKDADVDWSALSTDQWGAPLDGPVDHVQLFEVLGTPDQVTDQLIGDDTSRMDVVLYMELDEVELEAGAYATTAALSELSFLGTHLDVEEHLTEGDETTWLLLAGRQGGGDVMEQLGAAVILQPVEGASSSEVVLRDDDGVLSVVADLSAYTPAPVAPRATGWEVDTTALTLDNRGNAADTWSPEPTLVHLADPDGGGLLEPDQVLDTWAWQGSSGGCDPAAIELLDFEHIQTGEAFTGFTDEGLWLLTWGGTSLAEDLTVPTHTVALEVDAALMLDAAGELTEVE